MHTNLSAAAILRRLRPIGILLIAGTIYMPPARPQAAGTASIQGTVTDQTGAVVQNAAVTITDNATAVKHNTTTGADGLYSFPNIPVGVYTLDVIAPGFQHYTQANIVLEVGSSISVNAALSIGAADQHVEVKAEGLALQTEDSSFKQTIDQQTVTEMPQWTSDDSPHYSFRRLNVGSSRRLYRQQILLSDHLRLDRRRHGQHNHVAAGWRRQQRLHGQRQSSVSVSRRCQSIQRRVHRVERVQWSTHWRLGQRRHPLWNEPLSRISLRVHSQQLHQCHKLLLHLEGHTAPEPVWRHLRRPDSERQALRLCRISTHSGKTISGGNPGPCTDCGKSRRRFLRYRRAELHIKWKISSTGRSTDRREAGQR